MVRYCIKSCFKILHFYQSFTSNCKEIECRNPPLQHLFHQLDKIQPLRTSHFLSLLFHHLTENINGKTVKTHTHMHLHPQPPAPTHIHTYTHDIHQQLQNPTVEKVLIEGNLNFKKSYSTVMSGVFCIFQLT